jgi:phosphoenolpyruvate-protein kinase (PTS system EI component)
MPEQEMRGSPAPPGVALGPAWRRAERIANGRPAAPFEPGRESDLALRALTAAAEALRELATGLEREEAEIVGSGAMMALDPALTHAVEDAVRSRRLRAAPAILEATEQLAVTIEALDDERLAARADDVRSIGRRAARITTGEEGGDRVPGSGLILLAHDLGPADVAELAPSLAGIALVGGGATAHAAIVARSLGLPMVTGLDAGLLKVDDGIPVALDGTAGSVILDPSPGAARAVAAKVRRDRVAADRARADHARPATTIDGRRITVLSNVASRPELDLALAAGAEGIGLLRTELAFLDATRWPSEQDHLDTLEPILSGLGRRLAVVRVLDFGADKSPPFLGRVPERGIELLLANPGPFLGQLRAILQFGESHELVILLPMVDRPDQVLQARALIERAAEVSGSQTLPRVGAMIETPAAAACAAAIASHSDLLSIGTNDLTAATLSADRFSVNQAVAHDPRVLALIASAVKAAHSEGIPVEVCGEAASDPTMLPLLVGLGIDELSVGAAQVGRVRAGIRGLHAEAAGGLASSALAMDSAEEVQTAVRRHQRSLARTT